MRNSYLFSKLFVVILLLLQLALPASAQNRCAEVFTLGSTQAIAPSSTSTTAAGSLAAKPKNFSAPTKVEKLFTNATPPLDPKDQLTLELAQLRQINPSLASEVDRAIRDKASRHSLKIDLTFLPSYMAAFINGPFADVVGNRGLSRPFMHFSAFDQQTLLIHHEGDSFPILVRWNDALTEIAPVRSLELNNQVYQLLELPGTMKTQASLAQIDEGSIYTLIGASALNKYISGLSSPIMTLANLLHEGQLVIDRPTQTESKGVRILLDNLQSVRQITRSLLFVAPTASGKTRVLGDFIVNKVLSVNPAKKLILLTTKTPDLTSDLAKAIGAQLQYEVGAKNYRLVQWGGELSDEMDLKTLEQFIDQSPVPVVLVTSYPTLASRAASLEDKTSLISRARALAIDEAHNATGDTFTGLFQTAVAQANVDRKTGAWNQSLDIFAVTASPITHTQRTSELYDQVFWAALDKPKAWSKTALSNSKKPAHRISDDSLEWLRMNQQYVNARNRGEISSSDPIFYHPEEHGFKFSSIFKRMATGTQPEVNIDRLKEIWPDLSQMIEGHGPGVIQTYKRDADIVAATLSSLSGKNFVSLENKSDVERAKIYVAFRTPGVLYRGQPVDAIVGKIREGLDFPQAGWYFSFKKTVRFPENIQGPGRVMRLALNKLPPVIAFFGEDVAKVTYAAVRELVFSRLGRLPKQLPEGRLWTGMRRATLRDQLSDNIEALNLSVEALIRIQSEVAHDLGSREKMDPDTIAELQEIVLDMRSSESNREIAKALNDFVNQMYSYPFFSGQLDSTWKYCDKLISLEKAGPAAVAKARTLSPQDLALLNSPQAMALVKEFRSLYATIGPAPRAILQGMDLSLANVTDVAQATNNFVAYHHATPMNFAVQDFVQPNSLSVLLKEAISISPQGLWRNLSPEAKNLLASSFEEQNKISFEQAFQNFYFTNSYLPRLEFDSIDDPQRDVVDNFSWRLAEEMIERLKNGDLDVSQLDPRVLQELDQSEVYAGVVLRTAETLRGLSQGLTAPQSDYLARLKQEGIMTFDRLSMSSDFGVLRIIKAMDNNSNHSHQYRLMIEQILQPTITLDAVATGP